jgi:hypothetical protein
LRELPVLARLFVGTVIGFGAVLLAVFLPYQTVSKSSLWLFLLLLGFSSLTSIFKVNLPLARSGSTLSVSYAVDFASLLLLGPHETMIVAAASAYSQCTFRIKERNPLHRTMFSMACLVITVQAAGAAYVMLGGTPGNLEFSSLLKPLVAAATTYFIVNTLTIATAIALSTGQSIIKVWNENFLWSAPSYFVGAGAAAIASWMVVGLSAQWLALLAAAPLYLTYRTYKVYLGRIEDEQRHVREMADLHRRPSKRWRSRSTRRIRHRSRTSAACSSTRRRWQRRSACPTTTCRGSRPPRCCTTSASSPCPSTSSRSRARSRRKSS